MGRARRRVLKGLMALAIVVVALATVAALLVLPRLGGAFTHQPEQMSAGLSTEARALIARAFDGLDAGKLADYHVHVVGLGRGGSGAWVNPLMQSWWHPLRRIKFDIYAGAAGVSDPQRADQQYVERLARLGRSTGYRHGTLHLLAFDRHYNRDGTVNRDKTEFYVPNAYVFRLAAAQPGLFVPTASVHPYRRDALEALDKWARRGARMVKWLPNAMGIDPADARLDPFYRRMKALDLTLLTHAGEEKAVEAGEDQKLGNPLRLRRALDLGVKVLVAHCASLGVNADLDRADHRPTSNFELLMRLMGEKKYRGLLYGEISAMIQFNRLPVPLLTVLRRKELHSRLVNGSDYPLPAINITVRTRDLMQLGLISARQRELLNEIYGYNPLLFDFVVKRTLRLPSGERLSPEIFLRKPELG